MILEFDLFFSQLRPAKYFNQYIWNLAIDFFLGNQCSKAVAIFENDERFKAVERDRDRKDMFDSFLEELVNKVYYTI
jgi:hypothetical protein